MPHQPVIDGFAFAESGKVLQGRWPIVDFPRLRDLLSTDAGAVEYVVSSGRDSEGRPGLRIEMRGALSLTCQRCLQPLDFRVALDTLLTLARNPLEGEDDPLDSSTERVVAGREMAVGELLEDELVLALPFAPRHEVCVAGHAGGAQRGSPFAKLRGLLGPDGLRGRKH